MNHVIVGLTSTAVLVPFTAWHAYASNWLLASGALAGTAVVILILIALTHPRTPRTHVTFAAFTLAGQITAIFGLTVYVFFPDAARAATIAILGAAVTTTLCLTQAAWLGVTDLAHARHAPPHSPN